MGVTKQMLICMLQFSSEEGTLGDRYREGVGVCANMWWVCGEVGVT